MSYTITPKPTGTYSKVTKFDNSFILLQSGDYLLYQDGTSKMIYKETQDNNYTKVAKT